MFLPARPITVYSVFLHNLFILDIIGRVKNGETVPCRPVLYLGVLNVDDATKQLMANCWQENTYSRPSFQEIKNYIRKNLQKGS